MRHFRPRQKLPEAAFRVMARPTPSPAPGAGGQRRPRTQLRVVRFRRGGRSARSVVLARWLWSNGRLALQSRAAAGCMPTIAPPTRHLRQCRKCLGDPNSEHQSLDFVPWSSVACLCSGSRWCEGIDQTERPDTRPATTLPSDGRVATAGSDCRWVHGPETPSPPSICAFIRLALTWINATYEDRRGSADSATTPMMARGKRNEALLNWPAWSTAR